MTRQFMLQAYVRVYPSAIFTDDKARTCLQCILGRQVVFRLTAAVLCKKCRAV
uniref:Uncharacterized protein n=1 Tax=Anguilla anguilla TaxID=7936 RepID=A0A0E9UQS6_ANGAN